jgi:FlaA1/EpsC-like NDP-sugar epimerase
LKHLPLGLVNFLIGDVRDRERVFLAMEDTDIVFNAAAMKHVALCESNPFEAVKTNVLGVQNLVEAARAFNVEKFIHVSTDKAAMPVNVMGATKLLAEKITVSAEHYKGNHKTIFSAVRFGNVFGSRGSVAPIFYEQIKKGGPVTVTHKDMTRFMMRIPDAADLVLKAALMAKGGELFILKMPVIKISDLAEAMIEVLAPRFGQDPKKIEIQIIGKINGEKVYELLMVDEEIDCVYENHEMFCLTRQKPARGFKPAATTFFRSNECELMKKEQLVNFIESHFANAEY